MMGFIMFVVVAVLGLAIAALIFSPLIGLTALLSGRRAFDDEGGYGEDPYDDPAHEEYRSYHWG